MGRKKIQIKHIRDPRLRKITYHKRRKGLLKKIVELSLLCGVEVKLEIKDTYGAVTTIQAGKVKQTAQVGIPHQNISYTVEDYPNFKDPKRVMRSSESVPSQADRPEPQTHLSQMGHQNLNYILMDPRMMPSGQYQPFFNGYHGSWASPCFGFPV